MIHQPLELLGDCQDHILLHDLVGADGTRIFTAMTRIDDDDLVFLGDLEFLSLLTGLLLDLREAQIDDHTERLVGDFLQFEDRGGGAVLQLKSYLDALGRLVGNDDFLQAVKIQRHFAIEGLGIRRIPKRDGKSLRSFVTLISASSLYR